MSWLAGILGAVGIGGAVTLGIYIARLAVHNRQDLHKLIQATKETADARRDHAAALVTNKDLAYVIKKRTAELVRERAALVVATKAMENVAARTDAAGVADDLNSALRVLSNLSKTSTPTNNND